MALSRFQAHITARIARKQSLFAPKPRVNISVKHLLRECRLCLPLCLEVLRRRLPSKTPCVSHCRSLVPGAISALPLSLRPGRRTWRTGEVGHWLCLRLHTPSTSLERPREG